MNNSKNASEHVRPMLNAMAKSIEAARKKRNYALNSWDGSSEGTTPIAPEFEIGSQVAANGKAKAQPKSPMGSFFRSRDTYRKAS